MAAQPPPEAVDVEALGASVATHVTDACQVLVELAAATGVEAALAKGSVFLVSDSVFYSAGGGGGAALHAYVAAAAGGHGF